MKAEKKILEIPFDTNGNQMHHPYGYGTFKEYKKNYVFKDTLHFSHFLRGCSAAYAVFLGTKKTYTMFLTDLEAAFHYIKDGSITGKFTFCKRGQNFGVKLLTEQEDE